MDYSFKLELYYMGKMYINHIRRFCDQITLMFKVGKWLQCSHYKQV